MEEHTPRRRLLNDLYTGLLSRIIPSKVVTHPRYFDLWQSRGYHITPVHFYAPVPDTRAIPERVWREPSAMVGVHHNPVEQLARVREFAALYAEECKALLTLPGMHFDWLFLHCMIRHHRPRRVVEVGSGLSTRVIAAALLQNQEDGGPAGVLHAIDPYPVPSVVEGLPGLAELRAVRVQDVPLEVFETLGENDVLFIDSSHVSAIGSDVNFEILEILPRLAPGVLVHVHDIYLPYDYPPFWAKTQRAFWNEAYLLQAFLTFNPHFDTLWSSYAMSAEHSDAIVALDPTFDATQTPSSYWIRRTKPASDGSTSVR